VLEHGDFHPQSRSQRGLAKMAPDTRRCTTSSSVPSDRRWRRRWCCRWCCRWECSRDPAGPGQGESWFSGFQRFPATLRRRAVRMGAIRPDSRDPCLPHRSLPHRPHHASDTDCDGAGSGSVHPVRNLNNGAKTPCSPGAVLSCWRSMSHGAADIVGGHRSHQRPTE
jgi:hypothetical protein